MFLKFSQIRVVSLMYFKFGFLLRCLKAEKMSRNSTESQNSRDWKGSLEIIQFNTSTSGKASRCVLNISRRSTISLISLLKCSVTLKVRKFFLRFVWNFPCSSLLLLPVVLLLGITAKRLAPSDTCSLDIYKIFSSWFTSLKCLSLPPWGRWLQSPIHLCSRLTDSP